MFNGDRLSVWNAELVLELDSGDRYATLQIYLPLSHKLKNN